MVRENLPVIGNNLWCIFFHDPKLHVHYRRKLEFHLKTIFHSIDIISDKLTFTNAIQHQFIVDKLVFIVSGDKVKEICRLINCRKDKLKNPLVYELQFGQDSLKSNLNQDKKCQSIERLFNKIQIDIKSCIEIPTQSCSDASGDDEEEDDDVDVDVDVNTREKSTLRFGIDEMIEAEQSICYLKSESLKFVLFQVVNNVILEMDVDNEAVRNMWRHCRQDPTNARPHYLQQIDDFETNYTPESVIRFYTTNGFLFRNINKAFRCENIEKIHAFRPFLKHLHEKLDALGTIQRRDGIRPRLVLRGKKLPKTTLQLLQNSINKLISINGLLSTTTCEHVVTMFADNENPRTDYETVIIEMHIDETQLDQVMTMNRPFAYIAAESEHPDEQEVLFFVGFVWLIKSVEKADNMNIWKIKLQLSTDMNRTIIDKMNKVKDKCNYFILGKILHELGKYTDAIIFYDRMVESCPNLSLKDLCIIHFHIAQSAFANKLFPVAREYLKKAEEYLKTQTTEDNENFIDLQGIYAVDEDLSSMSITNNMGLVYQAMNDYANAQRLFEKALTENGSTNDQAHVHYCIGVLKFCDGLYPEARENYLTALSLVEDAKLREEINQRLSTVKTRLAIP